MSIQPEQLLCPVLVGREDELALLRGALDRAVQGRTRGIFLAGEAGIGKSRLCRALLNDARRRGLHPLVGLSSPQETGLPYGPLVDALQRAFTRAPLDSASLHAALAPVLPTLAPLLPEFGITATAGPTELPAVQRRRLFDALAHALRAVAAHYTHGGPAPLVLVLEDLHWADESTLDWLGFLLLSTTGIDGDDSVSGQGLLVVGTFRNEGLATAPALARTVSMLRAKRVAHQIDLRPLAAAQVAGLLEATLGRSLPADAVEALCKRSEGNPFIAEELLSAMAAAGYLDGTGGAGADVATLHLPLSLRGAVLERLDLLPTSARRLLSTAAVAGRAFDLDLLAGVTELDEHTLLEGLRLAVRGGLIEENPARGGAGQSTTGDRYRFRHALTREVVYTELLGPERRALHSAVARALEERLSTESLQGAAGETIEALAYHYRLAGDRVKAPAFALRAAERARALLAFTEARRHYAEALSYRSEGDPARLPLLENLGLLSLALLDIQGAVSYLDAAITLLRALGLARKAAVVLGEMHHLLWFVNLARFHAMVEELDAAAEAAHSGADGAGPEDADALKTYAAAALAHAAYANYARADLWARRALNLAATLDRAAGTLTSPAAYKALLARGHARLHGKVGESAGEREIAQAGIRDEYETLELGLRHALPEVVQLAYNFLPRGLLEVGRDAEAARLIDAADHYAQRSGVAAIGDTRGYSLLFSGRWAEGITAMREAVATSRAIGSPGKLALELTALGHLLVAQGDGPGATEALEEALAILEPSGQWVILAPCLTGLARARALLGDHDGAAALFARAHTLWRSTQDRGTVALVLLDGCLFHADRGDAQLAMEWADDLACVAGDDPVPVAAAAAAHARGAALAAHGGYAAALEPLGNAVQRWEELRRPYDAARARAALGAALLATSPRDQARRAEADTALVVAEETFRQLGAVHDVTRVEGVRRRGGLLAQARRRQSLSQGRAPFGNLTPREREVLILLAQGHTNREIAQALFIAEGTAELHVSRILGKLGCATRAQAAAYAVTHGLAEAT